MEVSSTDIPQAPDLAFLRRLVDTVAESEGAGVDAIAARAKVRRRAAMYYLAAAGRTLGLVEERYGGHQLTKLGRRLVETQPGSAEERSVLAEAIRASEVVKWLAGNLLGPRQPRQNTVAARAMQTGLAEDTARQRAGQLIKWRAYVLSRVQPPLALREPPEHNQAVSSASEPDSFESIGPEWSRPRKISRVLADVGHEVPQRLRRQRLQALVDALEEYGIELGTLDGDVIGRDAGGVSINAKVRLRRKPPPKRPTARRHARDAEGDAVLSAIHIGNFKSFLEAELPLSELTLLIGANASGKSNALEALQLLSWLSGGQRLSQLSFDVKDGKLGLRGRPVNLPYLEQGEESVQLGCSLAQNSQGRTLELNIHLAVDRDGLRVVYEELACPEESSLFPLYRIAERAPLHGREMQVAYNNFAKGGMKPKVACVDEAPVFTQLSSPARFGREHKRSQQVIPRATKRLTDALQTVLFLDPDPRSMRGYTHQSEITLGGDGTHLSGVLYHLTEQKGQKQLVLDFIRALPEQDILDIGYVPTPRDEVMVQLAESFGGGQRKTDAELLSDGTLRVLAIAAALLSVPEGALVVIEEIDNGVHPTRAEDLMSRIRDIAAERQLRVLLTTHNPALLDSVPTQALPHVVAAFRDPETGQSRLMRLQDLATYPELVARGPLGQLVTRGILDRFLKQSPSEEERRKRNLEWFEETFGEEGA